MGPEIKNIFPAGRVTSGEELFEAMVDTRHVRIERIISTGQATPPGQWFDQDRDEWVMVLSGGAAILFEGEQEVREMRPGDYVLIPAHARHRVAWTDAKKETVWLAVHFPPSAGKVNESK